MSKFGHCQQGGMTGLKTTKVEASRLSNVLKTKYIDEYVLLPGFTPTQQKKVIQQKKLEGFKPDSGNPLYWERNDGAHGWCCRVTGEVTQWG